MYAQEIDHLTARSQLPIQDVPPHSLINRKMRLRNSLMAGITSLVALADVAISTSAVGSRDGMVEEIQPF